MEATKQLEAVRWSPASARRFCSEQLARWGISDDTTQTVQLVVSELVTNAVCHARTQAELTLRITDDCLRIEVSDKSDVTVEDERRRGDAPGGWGIPIVEALTERWGVVPNAMTGKTVWAELDTCSAPVGWIAPNSGEYLRFSDASSWS
jgi:anti-sigma regulatory factor (Ser/Thr protein kinase)